MYGINRDNLKWRMMTMIETVILGWVEKIVGTTEYFDLYGTFTF